MLILTILMALFIALAVLQFFYYLTATSAAKEIRYLLAAILFSIWALGLSVYLF